MLPPIPNGLFENLFEMMKQKNHVLPSIPNNNRKGFPSYKGLVFGICKARNNRKDGLKIGLSRCSEDPKWTQVYQEIQNIGKQICPFHFTSIYFVKNLVSPPHKDKNNVEQSLLVSFGNYQGCNIVIEGAEYDARANPIIFDGCNLTHWNTPLQSGVKYSMIYYNANYS